MTGRQLARALSLRAQAKAYDDPEQLVNFAVAQVRAPMTRRQRAAYAVRLGYVALTGRRPW